MSKEWIHGANPYMPLWEHVPDGEPRVFTYGGETRVYVYGSHDTMRTEYCGMDYVVWSAPVTDLTDWRCDGVCYRAVGPDPLYAPDVVQKGDTWYLYAAEGRGSRIMVATAKTPFGPFEHPVLTELGFDPGILVDDDGRVYAYWGFCASFCGELNEDMATLRPGTRREFMIGNCRVRRGWFAPEDADRMDAHQDPKAAFFEASSPRKILGKYVFIYSKRSIDPQPELGVYDECNGFLSYQWSDHPLEGYRPGGDVSFNGGEILRDAAGRGEMTYRWGNNHGSVMEVNGHWYVFYHRQTAQDEFSRQAMLEPIDVARDRNGRIWLGKIAYREGEPIAAEPVEMTSQGAHINGLDARKWVSAGYACHLHGGAGKAYIARVDEQRADISAPIQGITEGTVAGYRYLQFSAHSPKQLTLKMDAKIALRVHVRLDSREGKEIAVISVTPGEGRVTVPLTAGVIGKHAVYFLFHAEKPAAEAEIASFDCFTFDD